MAGRVTIDANKLIEIERQNMVVSRFQAKAALEAAGLLTQVETMMADAATPAVARLAWQDALEFRRLSPTILSMGSALGLTELQLDDLFEAAKGITA
jgi:hypothetical protein